MKWNEYKSAVKGSREAIIMPWFKRVIERESLSEGIGLDVGCGDGDLTRKVAHATNLKMIGIDIVNENINRANESNEGSTTFLNGDITTNFISSVGIRFDFAVSNCCFSHLSDDDVFQCLSNVRSSMTTNVQRQLEFPTDDN